MSDKQRVCVLFGGQSTEHEVSCASAYSVIKKLDKSRFDVFVVGITRDGRWLPFKVDIEKMKEVTWYEYAESDATTDFSNSNNVFDAKFLLRLLKKYWNVESIDVVFPVLHGSCGEDGTLQGLLELAGIPYVGCGVLASSVGMDKDISKRLFRDAKIPIGKYLVFYRNDIEDNFDEIAIKVEEDLKYPCFIKPANTGSSVGVNKARNKDELKSSLELAMIYDRKVIIEEFIDGREVECSVLGNDNPVVSVVGEVVPCNEFYDYNAKYIDNDSKIIIPAILEEETSKLIRSYAINAFRALECSGLSRVDFFVEKSTGEIYVNEINSMPGFTDISMYPKLWEATGICYRELLNKVIDLALERAKYSTKRYMA